MSEARIIKGRGGPKGRERKENPKENELTKAFILMKKGPKKKEESYAGGATRE